MLRSVLTTTTCCLAIMLLPLPGRAQSSGGCEVSAVRGVATVADRPVAVGTRLPVGAELRTGPDGRVRLRCVDGSSLVVGDSTTLKIERYEMAGTYRSSVSLLLETGMLGQKVAPAPGSSWEVRTPTAVTAVRGTEFIIEVDEDQATAVNVQSGKVEVEAMQSAAGGGMRALNPRSRVMLDEPSSGTRCYSAGGCRKAEAWSPERIKRAQDRLSLAD